MPVNKNAQFRYQILDRCFSDFSHKYDFDTLLEKVNDYLEDVQGGVSMIGVRQLRGDINAIRKMLPHGIYLDAKPYYDKKCYYRYWRRPVMMEKKDALRRMSLLHGVFANFFTSSILRTSRRAS